ncbi:hypothetical protein EVA_02784 [gut metagenome]|uniref:Uncharacterized protein n=1 Tax=gut metagenome TaxID=749906 RepID=J9GNC2_9ZZZZ
MWQYLLILFETFLSCFSLITCIFVAWNYLEIKKWTN